jgi:hypothetical protein
LCIKTPFLPLVPRRGGGSSIREKTTTALPKVADTGHNEWKSANIAPVRYCASYPSLKVHIDTQTNDWLYDDRETKDDAAPPTYEEAISQVDDLIANFGYVGPSEIPLSDFKSE